MYLGDDCEDVNLGYVRIHTNLNESIYIKLKRIPPLPLILFSLLQETNSWVHITMAQLSYHAMISSVGLMIDSFHEQNFKNNNWFSRIVSFKSIICLDHVSDRQNSKYKMWFRVWSYRFWECAISFYSVCFFHQEHHLSKCMRKAFSKLKFSSAKSQIFTATSSPSWAHLPSWHIFPFMGTSSPSWVHLPLHGHLFPFMGASTSSWPPLPLHGRIFPFVGTSITGRHFVQKWLSLGYRFGYRSKPETFQEKWTSWHHPLQEVQDIW